MNEDALQLWHGVLFRQRADLAFESISPGVQEWTGLDPQLSLRAIHPADRAKAELERTMFRLRHVHTWRITWVEQRRRAVPGGYEGYWENITDRTHLSQQLAQAHWKAALGAATQRLVHDFNNLLTGILSLSDAYLLRLKAEDPACEGLQLIHQNARQAADIVREIGGLFRDVPGKRSYENLAQLTAASAEMLSRVLPKYSTLKADCKQETIPVYLDAVDFRQVVVSLGLALTPPINLGVGLEQERACLLMSGVAAGDSPARLMAETFAERNAARFVVESNGYRIEFPVSDYTEAERQPRSILLISDPSERALAIAELLRRNAYEVVIGPENLSNSGDYRFDGIAALQQATGSLSSPADVSFGSEMTDKEVLDTAAEFFAPRV